MIECTLARSPSGSSRARPSATSAATSPPLDSRGPWRCAGRVGKPFTSHRALALLACLAAIVGLAAGCSSSGTGSDDGGTGDAATSSSSSGSGSGSSASSSGSSSGGIGGGHAFACGMTTCDSATQYCSIVEYGHAILPDGAQGSSETATCVAFDGGASCPGGGGVTTAGGCGCYESATGEVTVTECTP